MITTLLLGALLRAAPLAQVSAGPVPIAPPPPIERPRDRPFHGTVALQVDASDSTHKVFGVHERIPVQSSARRRDCPTGWSGCWRADDGDVDRQRESPDASITFNGALTQVLSPCVSIVAAASSKAGVRMDRRWLVVTVVLIGVLGMSTYLVDQRPSPTADRAAGVHAAIIKESAVGLPVDAAPRQPRAPHELPAADRSKGGDVSAMQIAHPSPSDAGLPVARKPPDRKETGELVAAAKLLGEWMDSPPPVEDDGTMPFRSAQTLHRELDTQGRDPDWSESAEAQLRAYLTFMAKGGWIDIAGIRCGESMCEIQATTRSTDALAEDNEDWNRILLSMPQQPWWSTYGFDDPNLSNKSMPDGRLMYVAFVRRKPV